MNYYELEACVIRAKNGSKAELLKILEGFTPIIMKNAKIVKIRDYDFYDLVQLGYVALINAVAKYRKGSNTFAGYAKKTIQNSYASCLRDCNSNELSLNMPLNEEFGGVEEFIDTLEGSERIEDEIVWAENIKELRNVVAKLPGDEQEFVIMLYYCGISIKVYAKKKGLTCLQAYRKRERVLKKLRIAMEMRECRKLKVSHCN